MTMNLYRIYDRPCGNLIVTVAGDFATATEAIEHARQNPWVCQQMTGEAVAFPCEEVVEWD